MKLIALTAFGLAGATGIGALSMRAMAASPVLAAPKSSCAACSMTTAVSDCLQVTEVSTDQVVTLATLDGSTATLLDASNTTLHATAEFGKVNSDGTYHAPLFVPPSGLDYVTISDNDGVPVARLMFQVSAGVTTVEPGTMSPGMATSAPETLTTTTETTSGTSSQSSSTSTLGLEEDTPVTDDSATALSDVEAVSTVSTSLGTAYAVPVRAPVELEVEEPTIDEQIVLLSPVVLQKGKKCGVFPKPPYVGQPCTPPGTKSKPGPWKKYRKGPATSVSVSLGGWGFSGTATFMAQTAVAVQYTDVYYCKDGVWTFDHTTKCVKTGIYRYGFSPYSAGAIIGTGYSFDTAAECSRL